MYLRDHFRTPEVDVQTMLNEIRAGTLVTVDPETRRPEASFLPWAFVNGDTLTSHIGIINPQARHEGEALVILMGKDAYVSEEWMKPGSVPSWNYETIHLYGRLTIHTDPEWIIRSFEDVMQRFSRKTHADYSREYLEQQTRASVGVEFTITEIQAKSKLSQNRAESEVRTIIENLEPTCPHLAQRMREVSLPHIADRQARIDQARSTIQ
ncbi:MAG: FMN-binding negative transcriptional regulator [Propionibacteriaceae bacterium]|jgi:transcriptional regulator|nr:FMN-binding negative transcriptional regulator [Propionibacteriaceae bacterium]